jgi:folate-binding protein YgfZ
MSIRSPFAEREKVAGARFGERSGVEVPECFAGLQREYEAVRAAAGLLDLSFRGLLELTGGERLRWLNGQITADVKALRPGEGTLGAALSAKGHILSDLAVYGLPASVWVELDRDRSETVRTAFDRHIIADDVAVQDASDRYGCLLVAGPEARKIVAETAGPETAALPPWHHAEGSLHGIPARIIRSPRLALPGYEIVVPAGQGEEAWETLLEIGRPRGLVPVGLAALRCLRIEAGWPWYGIDFDESNLLMESLTGDCVSFTKGCYIGQEVVIRIEHQGHVNKKLCGLVVSGEVVPQRGAAILAGGRTVGSITSAVQSPALNRVIALGYLRKEVWAPGTALQVTAEGRTLEARVEALPFVASDES